MVIRNEWPALWTPEAIALVKRASIVRELKYTYTDFRTTPALWLEETVRAIGLQVEFEREKVVGSIRR